MRPLIVLGRQAAGHLGARWQPSIALRLEAGSVPKARGVVLPSRVRILRIFICFTLWYA